jgi:PncC family amidohydrolase
VFPFDEKSFNELLTKLQVTCQQRSLTISTAESCTGGLIGALLSHQPGSSGHFLGGIVAYSNAIKVGVLEIPNLLIEETGAVSQEVARMMAANVRRIMQSSYSLAVTGIAGPGGGSSTKPVGTVWCAWNGPLRQTAKVYHFEGDREAVRAATAWHALQEMLLMIQEDTQTS